MTCHDKVSAPLSQLKVLLEVNLSVAPLFCALYSAAGLSFFFFLSRTGLLQSVAIPAVMCVKQVATVSALGVIKTILDGCWCR